MREPTMVCIKRGPYTNGEYLFCDMNDENKVFDCYYNGTDVKISIFVRGTRVTEVLNYVQGLLHKDSNFREELFKAYPHYKDREVRSISFQSTAGYYFVVDETSDVDALMKKYYRRFSKEVYDDDTEDTIVERENEKFRRFVSQGT